MYLCVFLTYFFSYLPACWFVWLVGCLCVLVFVCVFVALFVCLFACLFVCLVASLVTCVYFVCASPRLVRSAAFFVLFCWACVCVCVCVVCAFVCPSLVAFSVVSSALRVPRRKPG